MIYSSFFYLYRYSYTNIRVYSVLEKIINKTQICECFALCSVNWREDMLPLKMFKFMKNSILQLYKETVTKVTAHLFSERLSNNQSSSLFLVWMPLILLRSALSDLSSGMGCRDFICFSSCRLMWGIFKRHCFLCIW